MAAKTVPAQGVDTSSFKGKFLFVNYDHDRQTAPHRNAVFAHVQSQYSPWKKREDARMLRNSAKIPFKEAIEQEKTGVVGQKASSQQPSVKHTPPLVDGKSSSRPPSDEAEVELEEAEKYVCGPVTVLKKGQSDPFGAFAIPIDSRVNFLMTYCREVELPSVHRDGTNPKGLYTADEWATIVSNFEEPYSAYAHLTRVASAMPVASDSKSDLAITSLTFRGKVVSLLREKMAEKDAMRDDRVFGAIASMLHAEMYNSNVTGALFHSKMLAHMLQSGTVTVNLRRTLQWFCAIALETASCTDTTDRSGGSDAFYYDYQRAVMSFARPCFDYDTWIPQYFAPMWTRVQAKLPSSISYAAVIEGLDSTVDDDKLRQIFINLRHLNKVFVLAHADVKIGRLTTLAYPYMRSHAVHIMGQALNHYLDNITFVNECRLKNELVGESITHARVQAVLSLALLYWTRVVSKTDSFVIGGHKTIFVANAGLLQRFRDAYDDYDAFTLSDAAEWYSRSMLWALYIGAWSEQILRAEKEGNGKERRWFGSRLAHHTNEMGMHSWQSVREVLVGFIHFDSLPLNGSLWFHKVRQDAELAMPEGETDD